MRTHSTRCWVVAFSLASYCLSGCATLELPWSKDHFPKASAKNPVVQIVCLWEQAEGRDPENIPCRGFAGQIMFLANRKAMPVEVEGDVRIYLFDNIGTVEEQSKPLRQFDFSHDAWKIHLTKSAVGPSYSVFIPYVRRGQHDAQCSLRLQLSPKHGPKIFSQLTTLPLRNPNNLPESTIVSDIPTPEARLKTEVDHTLSRMAKKTSTIPLAVSHSGGLSIDRKRSAEFSEPAPTATPQMAEDRLGRMEKLLEQVLKEKETPRLLETPSSGIEQAHYETLSPVPAAEDDPPRRFKLNGAQ